MCKYVRARTHTRHGRRQQNTPSVQTCLLPPGPIIQVWKPLNFSPNEISRNPPGPEPYLPVPVLLRASNCEIFHADRTMFWKLKLDWVMGLQSDKRQVAYRCRCLFAKLILHCAFLQQTDNFILIACVIQTSWQTSTTWNTRPDLSPCEFIQPISGFVILPKPTSFRFCQSDRLKASAIA